MLAPFPIEIAFSHLAQTTVSPLLTATMIAITWMGSPTMWIGLGMGLYWLRHKKLAVRVMILSIVVGFAVEALKTLFGRIRPGTDFLRLYGDGISEKSFPSGHATLIAAEVMHLLKREKSPALFAVLGGALVVLVALSRVYLGLHYLGDVVAGVVLGSLIGWAFWKLHENERVQEWKSLISPYKYELLIAVVALIALALMLLQKEIGSIAATLGFLAGFFLFDEENDREKPLAFEGINMVKVVLGFFSTALFVLLNWQLVGAVGGYGIISFIVYFAAGIYAVAVFPLLWDKWVSLFPLRRR